MSSKDGQPQGDLTLHGFFIDECSYVNWTESGISCVLPGLSAQGTGSAGMEGTGRSSIDRAQRRRPYAGGLGRADALTKTEQPAEAEYQAAAIEWLFVATRWAWSYQTGQSGGYGDTAESALALDRLRERAAGLQRSWLAWMAENGGDMPSAWDPLIDAVYAMIENSITDQMRLWDKNGYLQFCHNFLNALRTDA